jgi:hypothetical protein
MVLWRVREYPVDKSIIRTRNGFSKGFRLIAFLFRKTMLIKKNYIMKKRIKDLYRAMAVAPKRGCGDET